MIRIKKKYRLHDHNAIKMGTKRSHTLIHVIMYLYREFHPTLFGRL